MPLINVTAQNDYTTETISNGWAYCSLSTFNWEDKTARFVYSIYSSKEAAYSGKKPIKVVEYNLGASETPAVTVSTLITPGSPAVYEYNEETEQSDLITPEVLPVYETTVVREALPGLPQLVADNLAAYGALLQTVDNLSLLLPEFAGSTVEA